MSPHRPAGPQAAIDSSAVLERTRGAWFPTSADGQGPGALQADLMARLSQLPRADDTNITALVLASVLESLVHALPPEIRQRDQRVRMSERLAQAVVRRDAAGMSRALRFLLQEGDPPSHIPLP